jgi:hypothetical protein
MTSTPAPPPDGPLGQQFTRRPRVYADQVDVGKVLVTGPASKEHPTGFSGTGIREGRKWLVETESGDVIGNAKNATHVGHVLAHHHGHEPGSFDVEYEKERY